MDTDRDPRARRVAVVTESFHPVVDGPTGTTIATRYLVDRLVDRGQQVLLVAPAPGLTSYRGAPVARIATAEKPGRQVRAALAQFSPDLVHVNSPGRLGRKALKWAAREGVPSVAVQTAPVPDLVAPVWQTKVAERADRLLVTSSWLVPHLARLDARATVWTPGVDADAFRPELREPDLHASWARTRPGDVPLAPDTPLTVVGYVGRLDHAHGVSRLVELADLPGIRLVVIGDGPQAGYLRRRLPRARFTGHLDTGDLARAMASLDLLVHPGEQESCCHALREAAACGVPMVAPRAGGAPDVVRHQETGLLHDPGDLPALRRAVAFLATDADRAAMGRHARELVARRTWSDAVDELVAEHHGALLPRRGDVPAA